VTDLFDRASDTEAAFREAAIAAARADIPKGEPGECTHCHEDSPRLVHGACARCRDRYGLE